MTTTVTVRTAGHTALITLEDKGNGIHHGYEAKEILLPGTERQYVITDEKNLLIEEFVGLVVGSPESYVK